MGIILLIIYTDHYNFIILFEHKNVTLIINNITKIPKWKNCRNIKQSSLFCEGSAENLSEIVFSISKKKIKNLNKNFYQKRNNRTSLPGSHDIAQIYWKLNFLFWMSFLDSS